MAKIRNCSITTPMFLWLLKWIISLAITIRADGNCRPKELWLNWRKAVVGNSVERNEIRWLRRGFCNICWVIRNVNFCKPITANIAFFIYIFFIEFYLFMYIFLFPSPYHNDTSFLIFCLFIITASPHKKKKWHQAIRCSTRSIFFSHSLLSRFFVSSFFFVSPL